MAGLWPLWERFNPAIARIRTLSYNADFETEADEAIAQLAENINANWASISANAWRVLLERQEQAIVLASVNEASGNMNFMPIPPGFSADQRTVAAALFLLHGMKLPFPVADRSGFDIPAGSAPESLRQH